jgi:hypothetical protein
MTTLADIMLRRAGTSSDADADAIPGATVARLLAATEALNLADPDDQSRVLEGVAELQRVIGDAADAEDVARAGSKTGWLLGALVDAVRLAMGERTGTPWEITGRGTSAPRRAPCRTAPAALARPVLSLVPASPRRGQGGEA